jgi:hypothetical protein
MPPPNLAVKDWSIEDVCSWISGLGLEAVAPEFKKNAVNGADLACLSEQELQGDLGLTRLQAKKIRNGLHEIDPSIKAPSDATVAPVPTPAADAPPSGKDEPFSFQASDLKMYKVSKASVSLMPVHNSSFVSPPFSSFILLPPTIF